VFCSTIATGKVADVAPGVSPSADLTKDLREQTALGLREVDVGGPAEEDLLEDPGERDILHSLIDSLKDAIERDPEAWKVHAQREMSAQLELKDSAFGSELDDPSAYEFNGRLNFWPDRELQMRVPNSYLEMVLKAVLDLQVPSGVRKAAMRAFLSRNVLAHILIYRKYQIGFGRRFNKTPALYFTHATRASLVPEKADTVWEVRKALAPRIILDLLDKSNGRDDFRNLLFLRASDPRLAQHRELLALVLAYQAVDNRSKAEEAAEALKTLSKGQPVDTFRFGLVSASLDPGIQIAVRQEAISDGYPRALQKVFKELHF
jgi:hypothetical protein